MKEYVVVLDFRDQNIKIVPIDHTQEDKIDEILVQNYDFDLGMIEYMVTESLNIEIEWW